MSVPLVGGAIHSVAGIAFIWLLPGLAFSVVQVLPSQDVFLAMGFPDLRSMQTEYSSKTIIFSR